MHSLLAQSGSGGSWFNPQFLRLLFIIVFVGIAALARLVTKIREQQAKAEQERARLRRQDDALRTGGIGPTNAPHRGLQPPGPGMSAPATQQDARRKLQELAERRRRELAEMMQRAQGGSGSGGPARASQQPPVRSAPPSGAPLSGPSRTAQPRPGQSVRPQPRPSPVGPQPQHDRKKRERDEQNRKAIKTAAVRHRAEEVEARRAEEIETERRRQAPVNPALGVAGAPAPPTQQSAHAARAATNVNAALARIATPRNSGAAAAEWRKAMVLSELLHPPVSMRSSDERVL